MGFLKTFCCCCNVRSGSIFSGFYSTVYSLLYVGMLFFRYVGFSYFSSSKTYSILVYSSVVIFGCHSISSLIVVLGICTDSVIFLFPFIFTAVVCMCHAAITICLVFVKELQDNGEIGTFEAGISVFHIINIVITLYCLLCVFSQTQDFMRGKGTARYYRRRRTRRRRRAAMIQEAMELGQQPPPLPFPFDELYNDLTPYPVPGPCVEPPSYVDKPPPYSTLPRPETSRQSVGDGFPGEADAGTTPEAVGGAVGGACAATPGTSGACADAVGVTQRCCDLGACGCQHVSALTRTLTRTDTLQGTNRIESGHDVCYSRSRDTDLCGEYANIASVRRCSSQAGASPIEDAPSTAQTAFVIAREYPSAEWDHHEGLVAVCDSITHI